MVAVDVRTTNVQAALEIYEFWQHFAVCYCEFLLHTLTSYQFLRMVPQMPQNIVISTYDVCYNVYSQKEPTGIIRSLWIWRNRLTLTESSWSPYNTTIAGPWFAMIVKQLKMGGQWPRCYWYTLSLADNMPPIRHPTTHATWPHRWSWRKKPTI